MRNTFESVTKAMLVASMVFGTPTFGQEEPSAETEISQLANNYDPVVVRQFFENIEGSWLGIMSFSPGIRSPGRDGEFELYETDGGLIQVAARENGEWEGGFGFCSEPPNAFCGDSLHGFHVRPDGLFLGVGEPQTRATVLESSIHSLRYKYVQDTYGEDVKWQLMNDGRLLRLRVTYKDKAISSTELFIGERR